MKRRTKFLSLAMAALLAACGRESGEASAQSLPAKSADGLTVLELYQSQGCSSCPPAIRNANALADRQDMLVLTFAVTYWDYLGWKDIYGKPAFTQRQRDYASGSGRPRVYTPQIVVNGGAALVGDRPDEIRSVAARSGRVPLLKLDGKAPASIDLAAAPSIKGQADVWLVRYDPKSRDVPIRAGENAGRTIAHRNIVVDLTRLGSWDGKAKRFALPAAGEGGLRTAVLVQRPRGGPLLAAARI